MKKTISIISIFFLFLAAAALSFYFFRDSDEKQLRRTLDELCEIISKSTNENPAVSGLKANRADKVFAPKCEVRIGRHFFDGSYTATDMGANIMRFKSSFKEIKVSYSDLETAVSTVPETAPRTAKLYFTGRCTGFLKNSPPGKNRRNPGCGSCCCKNGKRLAFDKSYYRQSFAEIKTER